MQMLRQIRGRGDSAIVYDPALEYTRRFYDPRHDIILNPLDKRCPYWGPAEELRRSSEADAIAVSLFQPPQDKKGEFFVEIPQHRRTQALGILSDCVLTRQTPDSG
jgi:hypothetical protein